MECSADKIVVLVAQDEQKCINRFTVLSSTAECTDLLWYDSSESAKQVFLTMRNVCAHWGFHCVGSRYIS